MAMLLGDDGTLDTVIVCSECGAEMRFNYEPSDDWDGIDTEDLAKAEAGYDDFVVWCMEQAAEDHECEATP